MRNLSSELTELLSLLTAAKWNAWVTHWKSAGSEAYSDHQLFSRVYSGDGGGPKIDDQIDGLGERMIALFGQGGVDAVAVQERAAVLLRGVRDLSAIERALKLEALLLLELTRAVRLCEKDNISLDNFLRTVADERSTVVYLLQQRLGRSSDPSSFGSLSLDDAQSSSPVMGLLGLAAIGAFAWWISSLDKEIDSYPNAGLGRP